jgi:hypothetical protein
MSTHGYKPKGSIDTLRTQRVAIIALRIVAGWTFDRIGAAIGIGRSTCYGIVRRAIETTGNEDIIELLDYILRRTTVMLLALCKLRAPCMVTWIIRQPISLRLHVYKLRSRTSQSKTRHFTIHLTTHFVSCPQLLTRCLSADLARFCRIKLYTRCGMVVLPRDLGGGL